MAHVSPSKSHLPFPDQVGRRFAVRRRREEPEGGFAAGEPTLTDVVGDLVAADDSTITLRTRRGDVEVPRTAMTAVREIPPTPGRRGAPHRAISNEDLQRVMVAGMPPLESAALGDWQLRAADGYTGRANSVLVVGHPDRSTTDAITFCDRWYRERGLKPMYQLPLPLGSDPMQDDLGRELLDTGHDYVMRVLIMTARTQDVAGFRTGHLVEGRPQVDDEWFSFSDEKFADHRGTAQQVFELTDSVFLIAPGAGVARLTFGHGWAGVFGVHVAPDQRRRGIGRDLVVAGAQAAQERGVCLMYLQVTPDNPAVRLYRDLGFTEHHEYWYAQAPALAP